MPEEVVMPRLSDSMEEGTVLKWLKSVGDEVAVGDELVEIETDKANMVYEADVAGTLTEVVAGEGETLAIGEVIAWVGMKSRSLGGRRHAGMGRVEFRYRRLLCRLSGRVRSRRRVQLCRDLDRREPQLFQREAGTDDLQLLVTRIFRRDRQQ